MSTGNLEKKAFEQVRKELAILRELSASLIQNISVDEFLQKLIERAGQILAVRSGSIVMPDPDGYLRIKASVGFNPENVRQYEVKPSEAHAGRIFLSKSPVISFTSEDPDSFHKIAHLEKIKNMLGAPMIGGSGDVLGVIFLNDKLSQEPFNEIDLDIVVHFANLAAIAVEKQHQFEELVKQKERDHELATKLEESLKELKAVNERLSESNRLKDEVLSICAHDVRSPLTAIVSYTQLLLTDDQLNERHRRQIEHIHRSSEKINNLVENLLLRARYLEASEPLTIELLSIAMLAKDAVNQVQDRILAKSLKIDIVEDWNGKVYADRFKLAQVFDNLLDNATKFTPEHGEIKIRISSSTEDGGVATITISNSGKGIAAEDIPRLFLKYFQTNSGQQQSGYGLGLAICRKNIELHGGKIEVESIPDEKTLFRFTIPIGSCNSISD